AATTPLLFSSGVNASMRTYAPRALNDPARCKFSHFRCTVEPTIRPRAREWSMEVKRVTPLSVSRAVSISSYRTFGNWVPVVCNNFSCTHLFTIFTLPFTWVFYIRYTDCVVIWVCNSSGSEWEWCSQGFRERYYINSLINAMIGTANTAPINPIVVVPAATARNTASGCRLNALPITSGCSTLDCRCCIPKSTANISRALIQSFATKASSTGTGQVSFVQEL